MGSDLKISTKIQEYILNNGLDLHPVQKEIISYNESLGDIKRMQISISQSQFLHLIVKTSNVKKILEIGTFTGLSTLSMSLALPEDGRIIALDKNQETNEIAIKFFEKAKQAQEAKMQDKAAYRQRQLQNYLATIDRLNKGFRIRGARVSAGLGTRTGSPTGRIAGVGRNVAKTAVQLNDILSKYQNRFLKLAQAKYYQRTTRA